MKRMKSLFCTMLLGLTISDVVWANTSPQWIDIRLKLIGINTAERDRRSSFKESCEYLLPLYEQENPGAIYEANQFWEISPDPEVFPIKVFSRCPFAENKSLKQELLKVVEKSDDDISLKKSALNMLGSLSLEGKRIRKDIYQAKEFFGQACDLGDSSSCSNYNRALSCQKPSSEIERSRCINYGWNW